VALRDGGKPEHVRRTLSGGLASSISIRSRSRHAPSVSEIAVARYVIAYASTRFHSTIASTHAMQAMAHAIALGVPRDAPM